ncbi:MAG: hypothetical protein SGPRY_003068 [Prymnesium sp.]
MPSHANLPPTKAALRGRKEREKMAQEKQKAHSHRLLHVRFVFLHVLKSVYLSFVEDGIVPARSLLAHDLTNSVDLAVDHLGLPLFDWAVIVQDVIRLPWYKRIWISKDGVQPLSSDGTPEAWDAVNIQHPGRVLHLASNLAATFSKKQRRWHDKLPGVLTRLGTWMKGQCGRLLHFLSLDSLLLKLNLTHYDEHVVYVLRCFILAHEEAQRELRKDFTVLAEVVEVVQESQLAVHEAFVQHMMERGVLEGADAQHMMHAFAADEASCHSYCYMNVRFLVVEGASKSFAEDSCCARAEDSVSSALSRRMKNALKTSNKLAIAVKHDSLARPEKHVRSPRHRTSIREVNEIDDSMLIQAAKYTQREGKCGSHPSRDHLSPNTSSYRRSSDAGCSDT